MASFSSTENAANKRLMKSLNSDTVSLIAFVNRSGRPARIFWLNFKGQRIQYAILQGNEPFKITTYVTHPWLCRDAETGDVLTAGGKDVYFPEASYGGARATVFIDIPGIFGLPDKEKNFS